ncbi:MAG: hypothetical protein WBH44_03405 [Proteocatella sp.]
MQIFNLKYLNSSQEVPKIVYKPINVAEENIYFEKVIMGMEDSWSEGIWEYNKYDHVIKRLDQGHHAENIQLYDFDTPVNFLSKDIQGSMEKMYFTTITEIEDEDYIEFFEINLETRIQKSILGFTFDKDAFLYKKMEILAPGYILFKLSYDMELVDSDFFDNMYLLDVEEKKYYEIMDEAFNINLGNRILIGETFEEQYVLVEECYLDEDEQFDIRTLEDVELAFDLPGEIEPEQLHINSIKIIKLSDFIEQVKGEVSHIDFRIIDKVDQDGVIRIIGETDDFVYYKKEHYDFILKLKTDFMSRRKVGRTEIHKISKENFETIHIKDVSKEADVKVNNLCAYEITEFEDRIEIADLETGELLFTYVIVHPGKIVQEIIAFKNNEYLIVRVSKPENEIFCTYEVIDCYTKELIIHGNDILTLDDYVFVV